MPSVKKISPCLWFDSQAEEAARYYVSIFERSEILRISRYTEAGKEVTEVVHLYVSTDAAARYAAGELTEQELVDSGSVQLATGTVPVKVTVSFADVDNES